MPGKVIVALYIIWEYLEECRMERAAEEAAAKAARDAISFMPKLFSFFHK